MAEEPNFEESVNTLRQARDELRVQLDLGKKEARQSWEKVEQRFELLEESLKRIRTQGGEAFEGIRDEIRDLIRDIRDEFDRMRRVRPT